MSDIRIKGIFSETYRNYRVVFNAVFATDDYCTLRLLNGSTFNNSLFTRQLFRMEAGTVSGNRDTSKSGIASYMNGTFGFVADFYSPALAEYTGFRSNTACRKSNVIIHDNNTNNMATTETWDGFVIGNMIAGATGQIAVYGWGST